MPETAATIDPYRAYNWRLEIGGAAQAYFTACSGIGVTIDVIKYREAGTRQIVRSLPGQVQYEPITLYYGLTPSRDVFTWFMAGVEGRAAGGVGINSGFADADLSGARSHAAIPMARAIAVRATGIRPTLALVAAMRI